MFRWKCKQRTTPEHSISKFHALLSHPNTKNIIKHERQSSSCKCKYHNRQFAKFRCTNAGNTSAINW